MRKNEEMFIRHEANARRGEKAVRLRLQEGYAGYGLYWAIVESLKESPDYTLPNDIEYLAAELRAEPALVKAVVNDFGLFEFSGDGSRFHSTSFIKEWNAARRAKQAMSRGGKAGSARRWKKEPEQERPEEPATPTPTQPVQTSLIEPQDAEMPPQPPTPKPKKQKVFVKPTVEEVRAYCTERGNGVDAVQFVNFYESKGWMVGSNHMKNWQAAVRTWEKRHPKVVTNNTPNNGKFTIADASEFRASN